MSDGHTTFNRRMVLASVVLGLPAFGAFGYAAQTGRINILTPVLPESGDLAPIRGVTLDGHPVPGLTRAAFDGGVTLLNVWASWCPDCRIEHPVLLELSKRTDIRLFGLAADDTEANASGFLREHGNPYRRLSLDTGRVYQSALRHRGIPQTYVFRASGEYVSQITGALTPELVAARLMPAIEKASLPA
ncbi:MAG: cytochrome c bioproteinis protein CcmG thioldisulfide interchange protein [Beijerinckiaceae bacterium]|nr:MAG: cytochrome c bioproteinis protein CcmG thioldisulfide interchange protein [Beijerinckiaceae bacterium]